MLILLINNEIDLQRKKDEKVRDYTLSNLLRNSKVMKGVLTRNTGGIKTSESILFVNESLENNQIFKDLLVVACTFSGHNLSMIVSKINGSYRTYFSNIQNFKNGVIKDIPSPPQPKKLNKINQFSINIEGDRFSFKRKNTIGITFGSKQETFYLNHLGLQEYIQDLSIIKSLNISLSNDHIYFNFGVEQSENEIKIMEENNRPKQVLKKKTASLDLGLNNLATIFVNDKSTQSLIFSGKKYKAYNNEYNKYTAKLQTLIKITKDEDLKKSYIKEKRHITEKRKRKFDTEFHQISSLIVDNLVKTKVKRLIISYNLSDSKGSGNVKLQKKTKQQFIQIPIIKLLKLIEYKALRAGIEIQEINEAFTSMVSCLSENVTTKSVKLLKIEKKDRAKELNGVRAKSKFKDKKLKVIIHSDINAAVNNIAKFYR
jgi:IS605 OrfB family transposase